MQQCSKLHTSDIVILLLAETVKNRQQVPTISNNLNPVFTCCCREMCISVLGSNYHILTKTNISCQLSYQKKIQTVQKRNTRQWGPGPCQNRDVAAAFVRSLIFTPQKVFYLVWFPCWREINANCEEKVKGAAWQTGLRF